MKAVDIPDIPARQLVKWTLAVTAVIVCFWLLGVYYSWRGRLETQVKLCAGRLTGYPQAYRLNAYPIDTRQRFCFLTGLTVCGKAALTSLGVEFVALPAVPEMRS